MRHALRRCALAIVAVVFAATAAGRPFVAMAMAERAMQHPAGQAEDCGHQQHLPSHGAMQCGMCCGPACGGCAPPAAVPVALGFAVLPSLVPPLAPHGDALPRAAASLRHPPAIGPPSARVA